MNIYTNTRNEKFIDKDLFDYINNIWLTYDNVIEDNSNIYFSKNTTINRLITDYNNKGISRVIKPFKANYVVIDKFKLDNYPQYFDIEQEMVTEDETKEPVFGIYNLSSEVQDTIELIFSYIDFGLDVKYVNQDRLNESLNNGFIINRDNYNIIKELVDSSSPENHKLSVNMLLNSDLKNNWEYILYIYHEKKDMISLYDNKHIIFNYIESLNLNIGVVNLFKNKDIFFNTVKNKDVLDLMENKCRQTFNNNVNTMLKNILGANNFEMVDFKLKYKYD